MQDEREQPSRECLLMVTRLLALPSVMTTTTFLASGLIPLFVSNTLSFAAFKALAVLVHPPVYLAL